MPNGKNCPNCGAPYDINLNKCPYCGTSYYDMSAIDFVNGEPFYLKIKTEMNGNIAYITQLVRPSLGTMEISAEEKIATVKGSPLMSFDYKKTVTTNINFMAIEDKNNNLFTITMEERK